MRKRGNVDRSRRFVFCTKQDPASQGVIVSRLAERLGDFTQRMLTQQLLPPVLQAARASPSLWLHAVPLVIKVKDKTWTGRGVAW